MTQSSASPPEELLSRLASGPRGSGTAALAEARDACAVELRRLGYETRELPFAFSAFPGRLATPLLGGAAALLVGYAGRAGVAHERWTPAAVLAGGVLALAAAGWWLARYGVLRAPLLRQRGVNLEAARPGAAPRVWLCAHLDSKSQPIPTLVRSIGLVLEGAGVVYALVLAIALALGAHPPGHAWVQAALLTLVGAVPVVLSVVGNRSAGAFDNASGVVTVLAAASQVTDPEVGVLITDAEELGLAGARAWAAERGAAPAIVLNCDGVDDIGGVAVTYNGPRPRPVLAAAARAGAAAGVQHESLRMLPGILTDAMAFSDAGIPSVTFSRGSLRSLMRVHSRRDTLARLRGTGIAPTARLMSATARELLQRS